MITSLDLRRITQLLINTSMLGKLRVLESKLHTAEIVAPEEAPDNLVTMNSHIVLDDMTLKQRLDVRLVYQLDLSYGQQVSVLSPLGTALLGMKVKEKTVFK